MIFLKIYAFIKSNFMIVQTVENYIWLWRNSWKWNLLLNQKQKRYSPVPMFFLDLKKNVNVSTNTAWSNNIYTFEDIPRFTRFIHINTTTNYTPLPKAAPYGSTPSEITTQLTNFFNKFENLVNPLISILIAVKQYLLLKLTAWKD